MLSLCIGLGALTTAATSTFLLKRESGGLDNTFRLQILDLVGGHLAEYLHYNLHSRRKLAENNHGLHRGREVEASVFEIREVAGHLRNHGSRMGASGDGSREELAQLSIGRTNTGGTETLLEVVSDLLYSSKVGNGDLDRRSEVQGNITKCSLSVVIPVVLVIVTVSWLGSQINEPLALCPKVGLHRCVPLLPVGASDT